MAEPTTIHSTFVLERTYPKPVERVFAAFADPEKKRRWFADGRGMEVQMFAMEFRTGGVERLDYKMGADTPFPGTLIENEGAFQDIVPNQRIVLATSMSLGGRRISSTLITFEFLPAGDGTTLYCTHQGAFFEGADGPKMREQGWRTLFDRLAAALEA